MKLDYVQTVAFAGLILFLGYGLKRLIPALARYNIPAPVAGGLPVAALFAIGYSLDWRPLAFDTTLQTPMQNTFFASVGFGASVLLLKRGGPLVLIMMIIASLAAALQNVLGAAVAYLLGEHPLMGVLAGSVTLTGGPATVSRSHRCSRTPVCRVRPRSPCPRQWSALSPADCSAAP